MDREDDAGLFGKPAVVLRHILATASGESSALMGYAWVYARFLKEHPAV
jgi:hypothetical protein